jgi:nitrous oxidase accessory protein NosD
MYNTGEDFIAAYYPTNSRMTFTNNVGYNSGKTALRIGGNYIKISNNYFYNISQYGIIVQNSDLSISRGVQVTDNFISNTSSNATIHIGNYKDIMINNNYVAYSRTHGINLEGCQYFTISSNLVSGSVLGSGMRIVNCMYGNIVGNSIYNNTTNGIILQGASGSVEIQISGNYIKNNGGWGVVGTDTNRLNVVGNIVYENATGQISVAGAQSVDVNNIKA